MIQVGQPGSGPEPQALGGWEFVGLGLGASLGVEGLGFLKGAP